MSKKPDRERAEQLKAQAKELVSAGKLTQALELYFRATDELPADPWLAHAAAEVARRLKQDEVAATYLRRSAAAFVATGFTRFALPALRNSWLLCRASMPKSAATFQEVTRELASVQRELGFETDALTTEDMAAEALRASNLPDVPSDRPPRESLARALASPAPARAPTLPAYRRWLDRIRRFCA